ncbi:RING finger domain protein [Taphrina deformans PYCC 5710]|uniref:RING finger domain protein n=1 Tax=Taphrina deformans (strain PYCC 5710 / ATCC 11124 / CBS 356.35 / IMI 108563 / JCM 9778 / NBRC 8474) TaxID=1097556 RepID=R4XIP1_TAPDE|nr:RING finger domain protein [Taphrina deformans PYCC 5710]|eukprot:CCG83238.1 RING finger domain protein [Taphrina deformans PYCC 5710]
MSKSLGNVGEIAVFIPNAQQKSNLGNNNGKSNVSTRTNNALPQNLTAHSQKLPRNTHRHHRKPEANLNHLLNFSYARQSAPAHAMPARRAAKSNPTYGRGSGYHPLDKAHFVNANYRFVVHPSGDYRPNLIESDIPIPWENVLQVLASVQSQCNACPICLEDVPVAPRMAKCGHIFCLPCALRYLDSEDMKTGKTTGKWRKCPICFDGVYASELRPVKWFSGDDMLPVKGQDITLQLIMREAGSMFALPRDSLQIPADSVPWHDQAEALEYARLIKGDEQYMTSESEREVNDLVTMRDEDATAYGETNQWTATAIEHIDDRATTHHLLGAAPNRKHTAKSTAKVVRPPIEYLDAHVPTNDGQHPPQGSRQTAYLQRESADLDAADDAYYFYQPRTGSHYYLASLDIRILKRAFGSFSSFPSALVARAEHLTTLTIDEDLRRKNKYLSHLPLGVLADDVLGNFKIEIEKRRKKRHDKAVSEESARRRAQAAEERRERAGLGELQWHDEDTSYFARNDVSNTYEIFGEDEHRLGTSPGSLPSETMPLGSFERRSIWGTALPPASGDQPPPEEDDEWKDQLEKFYQESAIAASANEATGTPGKKAKPKKKKLVLMTSGGGRGSG